MEVDRFKLAEHLFHEATALAPTERLQYIEQAARGDAELAAHVHRMIGYAERTSPTSNLQVDPCPTQKEDDASNRLIGESIGHYRIIDFIGAGGFGAVYRAEQERPVRRTVAMKIHKIGMDSRPVLARFEAERQALAMMEHPNIARIFDAGQTDPAHGSRPFFVMELVSGQPITEYCDRHRLDSTSRLELLSTVCQAVQHAHQKGIIHRDLKPSNILVAAVDGVATAKVIDFGIAKAIHEPLTDRMLMTQRLELLGTPQYMSPEQADPDELGIDTRTDIYSLGVILYELLTGSTPLDALVLRDTPHSRIPRLIREQAVERPSTRLTGLGEAAREIARKQNTDVVSLRRRLRGDLDWITLKALDPDRNRRYASASALADDIRRHLNHEPVTAGPPGAAYRVRKFIRRHRVGVFATVLVALAVIGGAIGTTVGMLRARESAQQALAVNEFMREVLTSADPGEKGADVRLVEVLDEASRTASERFAGHPDQEAMVREMLGQVYFKLAMFSKSTSERKQALLLWQQEAGSDDPRTHAAHLELVGALLSENQSREADEALNDLLPKLERAYGPNDLKTLRARQMVGMTHVLRGRDEQAKIVLNEIRRRAKAAGDDDALQIQVLEALISLVHRRLHSVSVEQDTALLAEMRPMAQEQLERSTRHLGSENIFTLRTQMTLVEIAYEQGEHVAVASACRSLLEKTAGRLGECHFVRRKAMRYLGWSMQCLGETQEPAHLYIKRIECSRQLDGDEHIATLSAMSDALPYLDRAGQWTPGEAYARLASAGLQKFGAAHGDMAAKPDLYAARFVSMQRRIEEADSMFQSLLSRGQDEPGDIVRARLHAFYGAHLAQRGLFDQAEKEMQTAVDVLGDISLGHSDSHPDDIMLAFIALYEAWDKPDKVAEYRQLRDEVIGVTRRPAAE